MKYYKSKKDTKVVLLLSEEIISGHIFELFDLYFLLDEQNISTEVFIFTTIDKQSLLDTLADKYTNEYYLKIRNDVDVNIVPMIKFQTMSLLSSSLDTTLILIDGDISIFKNLIFKQKILIRCDQDLSDSITMDNSFVILQDDRIYSERLPHQHHYIKKFYFKAYRKPNHVSHKLLLYLPDHIRELSDDQLKGILDKYRSPIVIATSLNKYDKYKSDRVTIERLPIMQFQNLFDSYLYTDISRNFDCSPRLLVECLYFDKPIHFHNVDPITTSNLGLKYRWIDIIEDVDKLILSANDLILEVI